MLVAAVKSGARYRMTKSGITIYGEQGRPVSTHFTTSDWRAARNLRFELRSQGIIPEEE